MQTTKTVEYKAFVIGHFGLWRGSGKNTHILKFHSFNYAETNGSKVIREYKTVCQREISYGGASGGCRTRISTGYTDISQITCKRCLKRLEDAEFKAKVIAGLKETVDTEIIIGFFVN